MYVITIYNYPSLDFVSDASALPTPIHDESVTVEDAKVHRKKNEIDSLTFNIYPDNPGYDLVYMHATTVKVLNTETGEVAFDGRVLTPPASMESDGTVCKQVTCEGLLGYLNDSKQDYLEERLWEGNSQTTGIQQFIDYVLGVHNSHMPEHKRVYRGEVDVETGRTAENIYKGTNFETTWEIIQELVDTYGGEIRARRGSDGRIYLDYKEVLGYELRTPIKLGLNLESSSREIDPNNLVTRLYPRGAKISRTVEDEDGNTREEETEQRVDIIEVNNGVAYIDDVDAIKEFGIIEGSHDWDDVTEAQNLLTKGKAWLEANNRLPVTTPVSVLDLSLIDDDYLPFEIYNWHPVENQLNDIDETLEIVEQTLDLINPADSTITLGESTTLQSHRIAVLEGLKGQVEYLQSKSITTERNIGYYVKYTMSAIEIAEDRIRSTVGEQLVLVGDQITVVTERVSQVEQTAESITSTVAELRKTDEYLETKIEQTATSITSTVTQAYKEYVNGQIAIVDTAMSEIRQTVNGISLKVVDGKLGSSASIEMTVGGTKHTGSVDLTGVRAAFRDDHSAITITAGTVQFHSNTFVVDSTYFKVSSTGVITATSGTIGGFTIGTSALYSDYIYLSTNYLNVYQTATRQNLLMQLGTTGISVWDTDSQYIGLIHLNRMADDASYTGLTFDLEVGGDFVGWGAKDNPYTSVFSIKLAFYRTPRSGIAQNSLQVGANSYWNNYTAYNLWIDPNTGGAVNGITVRTTSFILPTSMNSDGTVSRWSEGCWLQFTRGFLTGSALPQ